MATKGELATQAMATSSRAGKARDYGDHIAGIRGHELRLSSSSNELYLDAAGAPPAPRSVLEAAHQRFVAGVSVSNPHSHSPSGQRTQDDIDRARTVVCKELFGVERRGGIVDVAGGSNKEQGWELAFNSGTTAGLETVARAFSYDDVASNEDDDVAGPSRGASFAYLEASHSSLYGLRSIAQSRGVATEHLASRDAVVTWVQRQATKQACSLLALPMQCNATGKRYHDLVDAALEARRQCEVRVGQRRVYILVDAAALLSPSTRFPLSNTTTHQPDFVAFSFLKVLGYPSGLGGLLLQRRAFHQLRAKDYYGGGTLEATTSRLPWRKPMREISAALEDGTQNLFAILALEPALNALRSEALLGQWEATARHTDDLTTYLYDSLFRLSHCDGSPIVELYSSRAKGWPELHHLRPPTLDAGSTILFNILRAEASIPDSSLQARRVDPSEVDRLACIENIHLRSGRMCNVGAVTAALGIPDEDIVALWERGIGCGSAGSGTFSSKTDAADYDPREEARLQALVSGAIRVSLSAWSTYEDVDRLCAFLVKHFRLTAHTAYSQHAVVDEEDEDDFLSCASGDDDDESRTSSSIETDSLRNNTQASSHTSHTSPTDLEGPDVDESGSHFLREVYVYPIKSCAAQRVRGPWKLLDTGLEHDRSMCIVDLDTGKVLSQKRVPAMARIRPRIEPGACDVHITLVDKTGEVQTELTVPLRPPPGNDEESKRVFDMCGTTLDPAPIMDECIRRTFTQFLDRNCTLARMPLGSSRNAKSDVPLLLSNESPYLMVTSESIEQVGQWMQEDDAETKVDLARVGLAFRANFVVTTTRRVAADDDAATGPFYEDDATHVTLGPHSFTVLGACRRCEMIALDPITGAPTPAVMTAVARHRRCTHGALRGRLLFGQHLALRHDDQTHAPRHAASAAATGPTSSLFVKEGMAVGLHAD